MIREAAENSFIFIEDRALTDKQCDELMELYDQNEDFQFQGITTSGMQPNYKRAKNANIADMKQRNIAGSEKADHLLYCTLNKVLNELGRFTPHDLDVAEDFGYMFQVYGEGDFYKIHDDWGRDLNRQLTIIWYLNDVEEGGGTEFPLQKTTIQPKKGSLVIFPACWTHPHIAHEVKKGTKYIVTTWAG